MQEVPSAPNSSENFVEFKEAYQAVVFIDYSSYSVYFGAPSVIGSAYLPNTGPRLGVEFDTKSVGLSLSLALPPPEGEVDRRGYSRSAGIIFNKYWRNFGIDAYDQTYHGLYADNPYSELGSTRSARLAQLPDATVVNIGINSYYVFDPNRYGLSAAFGLTENQQISGGSFLISGIYNHLDLSLGNTFIPGSGPLDPSALPDFSYGQFDTVGVAGGYGHYFKIQNWYLAGQALGGPALQLQRTSRPIEGYAANLTLALYANVNVAAGYNFGEYTVGTKILWQGLASEIRNLQFSTFLLSGNLFLARRFD